MRFKVVLTGIILFLVFLMGCGKVTNTYAKKEEFQQGGKVIADVLFRAFYKQQPLSGVSIVVIDQDGVVIGQLVTKENGEAQQKLTVSEDRKYEGLSKDYLEPRGTVTAIAFKEGYKETVLVEVGINSSDSVQPFYMEPIVPGERNEPIYELGNTHHLEILSLVEKYRKYAENDKSSYK